MTRQLKLQTFWYAMHERFGTGTGTWPIYIFSAHIYFSRSRQTSHLPIPTQPIDMMTFARSFCHTISHILRETICCYIRHPSAGDIIGDALSVFCVLFWAFGRVGVCGCWGEGGCMCLSDCGPGGSRCQPKLLHQTATRASSRSLLPTFPKCQMSKPKICYYTFSL